MAKTTVSTPKDSKKDDGEKKPHADFDRTLFSRYAELLDKDLEKKCKTETDLFFGYTENTITIWDQFPKAIFHFLVLPRVKAPPRTKTNLKSLRSLFSRNVPKDEARQVIQEIAKDAYALRDQIRKEMMDRYRFTWDIQLGFHAIQSMDHIHLHVISNDFHADGLKTRKHINSFTPNPEVGYFLKLDDVLEWFEAVPEIYEMQIKPIKYEQERLKAKLRLPIVCPHCNRDFDNRFAEFKKHIDEVWDALEKREQAKADAREEREAREADRRAKRAAEGGESPKEAGSAEMPIEIDE
ncbi:HIT-like protein [Schizopora paradoxa]|uniref:HIT-like protein n=1 Tax=Schizopora paradoxa TaxID=27342 RepID=A0A0H2S9I9_9AGAM|nr:HIT-like protein [Schizopora paradoxa]